MSPSTLKKAAEKLKPVKSYIQSCQSSPKRDYVFCLVEGAFDKHIYEARLNGPSMEIIIAADDSLQHNRNTVCFLLNDLLALYPNGRFIGIRDKDYMPILGQAIPTNVFVTDQRDLEMMILSSSSFLSSDQDLSCRLATIIPYCREMAYIRIYAEDQKITKSKINKSMKIQKVYDQQSKKFVSDGKSTLRNCYFTQIDNSSSEDDLDSFIQKKDLKFFSDNEICRGHDVVNLLEWIFGNEYSRCSMEEKMEKNYSFDDFYQTSLFTDIQNYCIQFSINAKV